MRSFDYVFDYVLWMTNYTYSGAFLFIYGIEIFGAKRCHGKFLIYRDFHKLFYISNSINITRQFNYIL